MGRSYRKGRKKVTVKITTFEWTEEICQKFSVMWLRGDDIKVMATVLKTTPWSVRAKRARLGLPPRYSFQVPQPGGYGDLRAKARARRVSQENSKDAIGNTEAALARRAMPPDRRLYGPVEPCCWVQVVKPVLYCNEPSLPGKPYCEAHYVLAVVPSRALTRQLDMEHERV